MSSEIKNALMAGTLLKSGNTTYRVVRALGAGGFGITYLVEGQSLQEGQVVTFYYAMKEHFLSRCSERAQDSSKVVYSNPVAEEVQNSQKDFMAEAVRLQRIGSRHDNIVTVNEIFEANNTAYYTMEYLQGQSLREYVAARGRLGEQEMLQIMRPIIDAIGYLHSNKMTHLDIKPDNIMLAGRPVLIDFGLSKHYDDTGRPTSTINTLGCSDGFSPVEQYGGITTFSPTADIYALGATMVYCVTGAVPKKSTDLAPGETQNYVSGLSNNTAYAIMQMMNMNRMARPQTAANVQALLAPQQPSPVQGPFPGASTMPLPGGGAMPPGGGRPPLPPPPPSVKSAKGGDNTKKMMLYAGAGMLGVAFIAGVIALLVNVFGGPGHHDYDRGSVIASYTSPSVDRVDNPALEDTASDLLGDAPLGAVLFWDFNNDLDIYAVQPDGETLYFLNNSSQSMGGQLGSDDTGGSNSFEYVRWFRPDAGEYDLFVAARSLPSDGGKIYMVVNNNGDMHTYEATLEQTTQEFPEYYLIKTVCLSAALSAEMPDMQRSYEIGDNISDYWETDVRTVSSPSAVSRLRRAVGNVPFAIGLLWNSSNDLDLYVNQPDATDVYFGRTSDSDSGATFGGDVRGGSNSMEYIKWTRPDTGRYDVFVRACGSVPSSGIPVEVVVLDDGESTVYKAVLQSHGSSATDYKIVFYTRSDGEDGEYVLVPVIEEDEDEIEYIEVVPAPAASTPDSVATAPPPARQ